MQQIFIFLGNLLILVGFYFFIKNKISRDLNTKISEISNNNNNNNNNTGIEIINGDSYKISDEIEAEKELEVVEGSDYEFELSDDEYDDNVYDDEIELNNIVSNIKEINERAQKLDIKSILQEPADIESISITENLIFGIEFTKKSFDYVEQKLEKNVNDFIVGIAEKRKDIREFVLLHNGENYLEEYNKLNNNSNNNK